MSYQVLARKWRPKNFHEMVGQKHVLRALINALDTTRLHHAYLFTGTRGVGKTTIARIFAKSLNCEQGITSTPCGQCGACTEINEGRFVDLIEVDAASRTKVEDTREILENVQYAPTRGRFKVYLIDEVHMLSKSSFNALLKTLEEPPEHVKFLLATTDPQKLPATVLSRCLQFNLKNMSMEMIIDHLAQVLDSEQIHFEQSAIVHIAKAARGSMRDAMSLTDQAIAFGQGQLLEQEIIDMLGSVDSSLVLQLVDLLFASDAAAILDLITQMHAHSPDYLALLQEMIAFMHKLAIAQMVPSAVAMDTPQRSSMLALAKQTTPEQIQLFYQLALQSTQDLAMSLDARVGFEMAMLRIIAFSPEPVLEAKPFFDGDRLEKPLEQQAQSVKKYQAQTNNETPVAPLDRADTAFVIDQSESVSNGTAASNVSMQTKSIAQPLTPVLEATSRSESRLLKHQNQSQQSVDQPLDTSVNQAPRSDQVNTTVQSQVVSSTVIAEHVAPDCSPIKNEAALKKIESLPDTVVIDNAAVDIEQSEQNGPKQGQGQKKSIANCEQVKLKVGEDHLPVVSQSQQEQWLNEALVEQSAWSKVFEQLDLTGMSATIFANSLWKQQEKQIELTISEQYKMLYNEQHLDRLIQALTLIEQAPILPITVVFASISASPAHYKQQQAIIMQNRARLEFSQYPVVQYLQSKFEATIIDASVRVNHL